MIKTARVDKSLNMREDQIKTDPNKKQSLYSLRSLIDLSNFFEAIQFILKKIDVLLKVNDQC